MSGSPRGWCPGVFAPMAAPDGLLVRIKPRASRLTAEMGRCIAEAVAEHGNGRIELTSRANLQIRGLTAASAAAFAEAMVAYAAADADPAAERRRNIIVSPLAGDDPAVDADTGRVAAALERALATSGLSLPDKFGFSVDGGGALPLGDVAADVALYAQAGTWNVRAAGAGHALIGHWAEAVKLAVGLARHFAALGGAGRMRDQVAAHGEDAVYAGVGARPTRAALAEQRGGHPDAVTAYPGLDRCAVGLAPPSGELGPETLARAAGFAAAFGDGLLRVSPWRTLLIGGVPRAHVRALAA